MKIKLNLVAANLGLANILLRRNQRNEDGTAVKANIQFPNSGALTFSESVKALTDAATKAREFIEKAENRAEAEKNIGDEEVDIPVVPVLFSHCVIEEMTADIVDLLPMAMGVLFKKE